MQEQEVVSDLGEGQGQQLLLGLTKGGGQQLRVCLQGGQAAGTAIRLKADSKNVLLVALYRAQRK